MYLERYTKALNIVSASALIVALLLAKFVMYDDKFLEFLLFLPVYGWASFLILCGMSFLLLFFTPRILARTSLQCGAVAIPWAILFMGYVEWYFILPMIVFFVVFIAGQYVLLNDVRQVH